MNNIIKGGFLLSRGGEDSGIGGGLGIAEGERVFRFFC